MIPNRTVSSYTAYDGGEDYSLCDSAMGARVRGRDALIGWMTVALTTEQGAYPIFSPKFGLPREEDETRLKRAIEEVLLRDERIRAVDKVEFTKERGVVSVRLTVKTVYGPCETDVILDV